MRIRGIVAEDRVLGFLFWGDPSFEGYVRACVRGVFVTRLFLGSILLCSPMCARCVFARARAMLSKRTYSYCNT